jgi:hypothetical protein
MRQKGGVGNGQPWDQQSVGMLLARSAVSVLAIAKSGVRTSYQGENKMTKNTRFLLCLAAVGLMAVIFAPCGQADTVNIPLSDPSFEDNPVAYGATSMNGIATDFDFDFAHNKFWTEAYTVSGDNAAIWNPTSTSFLKDGNGNLPTPATGSQALLIGGDWTNTVAVYQYVPLPGGIQLGTTYTATVAFGSTLDQGSAGYAIALTDESADLLAYINPDSSGRIPTGTGLFYDKSASFTGDWVAANYPTAMGQNLFLAIVGDGGAVLDNVRLTATDVPEPSTLVLLAAGVLSLLAYARRKGGK